MFESSVNSDSIQTSYMFHLHHTVFESSVNSDSIQTINTNFSKYTPFESSVNIKRNKYIKSLRVV